MASKTLPPSPSPAPLAPTTTNDIVFISSFLDINRCSADERRIVIFLFDHQGSYFSESDMRAQAGYISRHGTFVNNIDVIETQLNKMRNAPFRLLRKEVGDHYVYAVVSREFFLQYIRDQEAARTIKLTSLAINNDVQEGVAPKWDFQKWLDEIEYRPITGQLRFVNSASSVDAQVASHCMHTIAHTLAAKKNTWVSSIDLENAITTSLRTITLPSRYSWETHFMIRQLISEMRSNPSVTKNNQLRISTQESPRAYMLEVPPNFQG